MILKCPNQREKGKKIQRRMAIFWGIGGSATISFQFLNKNQKSN